MEVKQHFTGKLKHQLQYISYLYLKLSIMPSKCFFSILFIFLSLFSLAQTKSSEQPAETGAFANSKLTYKIIDAAHNTFCYDIFVNGKLMIHQPSIPAMSGNDGFKTKASAEKVAQLVISKIKKGEMPPSVTIEEMQTLKAIPKSSVKK